MSDSDSTDDDNIIVAGTLTSAMRARAGLKPSNAEHMGEGQTARIRLFATAALTKEFAEDVRILKGLRQKAWLEAYSAEVQAILDYDRNAPSEETSEEESVPEEQELSERYLSEPLGKHCY